MLGSVLSPIAHFDRRSYRDDFDAACDAGRLARRPTEMRFRQRTHLYFLKGLEVLAVDAFQARVLKVLRYRSRLEVLASGPSLKALLTPASDYWNFSGALQGAQKVLRRLARRR